MEKGYIFDNHEVSLIEQALHVLKDYNEDIISKSENNTTIKIIELEQSRIDSLTKKLNNG